MAHIRFRDFFLDLFFRWQCLMIMPPARTLLRIRVKGKVPERDGGGLIVAPNHQSWLDSHLVQYALYPHRLTFLMTENFYDLPVLGLYFRAAGARPVRESGPSVAGFRAAQTGLGEGEWIALYPEGEITRTGEMGRGRRGIARLARRTGARVLPVGIRGAIHVLSRIQTTPKLRPIEIRIGEPLRYEEGDGRDGEQRFTDRLMAAVEDLAYGP